MSSTTPINGDYHEDELINNHVKHYPIGAHGAGGLAYTYSYSVSSGNLIYAGPYDALSYTGVHIAHFIDGDLLVNPNPTESSIDRLYDAAFGRAADMAGLTYWVSQVDGGTTLNNVAQSFAQSDEFAYTYGSLQNSDFVTAIYRNVLHRDPDSSGKDFYTNQINSGVSRGDVLLALSESSEHASLVAAKLPMGGEFVVNNAAATIEAIYDTFLGRLPDESGLTRWIAAAKNGTTIQQIADSFAQSPEFIQKNAGTNDSVFVQALYQNTLHRAGEASGVSYWTSELALGHSRAEIALDFAQSPEHAVLMRPHIDHGLDFL